MLEKRFLGPLRQGFDIVMNKLSLLAAIGLVACGGSDAPDCDTPGHACTWLGLPGEYGFNGDGKDRLDTKLYWSMDMAFATDGTPWFIDWNNHMVRRVLPDQTVETVLGWMDPPFPGDGGPGENTAEGAVGTEVQLNHPTDLAFDRDGTLLVMAWHNHKLRRLDPITGRSHIECGAGAGFGGDGGDAKKALFRQPKALVLGPDGERYILDQQNWRIREIDAAGVINTIAGTGVQGSDGDAGPALAATLDVEGGSNPEPSGGLALDGNLLYYADTLSNRIRVIDLASDPPRIDAFAGTGEPGFAGDGGPALAATLYHPRDLEIGPDGDLYVADTDNGAIRAVSKVDGTIRTVAGTGELGLNAEGLLATETLLRRPFGIEFDAAGNLYISDSANSRIVRVAR
jgi:DNA-binding beta-propeller fold protein YncE